MRVSFGVIAMAALAALSPGPIRAEAQEPLGAYPPGMQGGRVPLGAYPPNASPAVPPPSGPPAQGVPVPGALADDAADYCRRNPSSCAVRQPDASDLMLDRQRQIEQKNRALELELERNRLNQGR